MFQIGSPGHTDLLMTSRFSASITLIPCLRVLGLGAVGDHVKIIKKISLLVRLEPARRPSGRRQTAAAARKGGRYAGLPPSASSDLVGG